MTNRRALGCLLEIVETVVLTLVLFWAIQSFVAQPFQVQQHSMENTIHNGQYVLVDRLTPRFDPYHRGDIIVFTPPIQVDESPKKEPFIKRVIGVANDKIDIHDGQVFVNGIALDEPYLYAVDGKAGPTDVSMEVHSWTLGPGQLFVMGDHREASTDSRVFGPISVDSVIGRAWLRYWPLDDLEILPTDNHPELASPSPGPSPSASPAATPKATHKATPKPTHKATPKP